MVGIEILQLIVDLGVGEVLGRCELYATVFQAVTLVIIADKHIIISHGADQAERPETSEQSD